MCPPGLKIQLFKNFRSRENVLKYTNTIFENIMSKKLGDIDYTEEEFLNLGADYLENNNQNYNLELNLIDLNKEQDEEEDETEVVEKIIIEAKLVAKKIKKIVEEKYQVFDRKLGYRDIKYKDIVILLRSTSEKAQIYEKELSNLEIPVFSDSNSSYLETAEIQTIINLLKIIDNPMQDIPLVSVLRSEIANFIDDELIEIRVGRTEKTFYESLLEAKEDCNKNLQVKINNLLNMLEDFKRANEYLPLSELIWKIYMDTGYLNIVTLMNNGELKVANLKMLFEKAKQYENASFKGLFNFILFIDKMKTSSGDLGSAKLIGENANVVRIMSIHKSKGLEFPVVFLCETGKKINLQDLNESILMHQELGLGPKCINYKKSIEYNTLAKEALKNVIKNETISEEMRVLYVALTRSKEKLIITGRAQNLLKNQTEKQEMLEICNNNITPFMLRKYTSYLDWFLLVYAKDKNKLKDMVEIKEYKAKDILQVEEIINEKKVDITKELNKNIDKVEVEKIKQALSWNYTQEEATKFISKTSVSEIKLVSLNTEKYEKINLEPKFLSKEKTELTGAEKGTLMHLILQKIDFKQKYNSEKIQELLQKLVEKNIINELEIKNVNIEKIQKFLSSDISIRISNAKEIHKEEPFYININANEIYDTNLTDNVLVQGVIDLYFIDENNKLVLLDYKTDYVQVEEELVEKYKTQLSLYKRALENALSKKVDEVYIYSTHLNKEINIAKLCKL